MLNFPYLFAAFSVIWVVIFLYTLIVARQQRTLAREISMLRQMVEKTTAKKSEISS